MKEWFPLVAAVVAGLALAAIGAVPEFQPVPRVVQIVAMVGAGPVIGYFVRAWGMAIGSHALLSVVTMNGAILFEPPDGPDWSPVEYVMLANLTALLLWALAWPLLVAAWSMRESQEVLRNS